MEQDHNRIIYREGRLWINHRIDGRGPDTRHRKLNNAIQRATRSMKKVGDGKLKIKDAHNDTLINALVIE